MMTTEEDSDLDWDDLDPENWTDPDEVYDAVNDR